MSAVRIHIDFGDLLEIWQCSTFSPSICHEVIGLDAMIFVFRILSFKPTFYSTLSASSRGSLFHLHFLPGKWCHLYIIMKLEINHRMKYGKRQANGDNITCYSKISGLIKKSERKSKYTLRKIEKNWQLSGICVLSCSDEADSLWPQGLWPAGSTVHGILQARILERVAISSSKVNGSKSSYKL